MKRLVIVVGCVASLVLLALTLYAVRSWRVHARTTRFNEEADNLFVALQKYKEHVGAYPHGSNREIAEALRGHNPKNIIILVGRRNNLNEKGEMVDPWGTPLRIYYSDHGVLVRSAGPNRRFDDSTVPEGDDFFRSN